MSKKCKSRLWLYPKFMSNKVYCYLVNENNRLYFIGVTTVGEQMFKNYIWYKYNG